MTTVSNPISLLIRRLVLIVAALGLAVPLRAAVYNGNGYQWRFFNSTAAPSPFGLLERVVDPLGKNDLRVAYDKNGRKTSVRDALDRTTSFSYNPAGTRTLTTSMGSRSTTDTFDRKLRRISTRNALNHTATMEYDDFGNTTATVDPRGTRTEMTYDARSNLLSSRNIPLNLETKWIYGHSLTHPSIPAGGPPSRAAASRTQDAA